MEPLLGGVFGSCSLVSGRVRSCTVVWGRVGSCPVVCGLGRGMWRGPPGGLWGVNNGHFSLTLTKGQTCTRPLGPPSGSGRGSPSLRGSTSGQPDSRPICVASRTNLRVEFERCVVSRRECRCIFRNVGRASNVAEVCRQGGSQTVHVMSLGSRRVVFFDIDRGCGRSENRAQGT